MQEIKSLFSHQLVKGLDSELEKIFKSAPHLPKKVVDVLVKIAPYLVLVSGLFMITGGLRSIFDVGSLNRIHTYFMGTPSIYFYLVGILQILTGVVSVMAYKPLKENDLQGWYMLFCLTLLELVMNLLSIFFLRGGLIGLLISLVLSFYILYEVKPAYQTAKVAKTIKKIVKQVKAKKK